MKWHARQYIKICSFFFLLCPHLCAGQEVSYSPAQIQDDVQYLHDAFQRKHPNLYLYSTKQEIDDAFTRLSALKDSLSAPEFYDQLTGALSAKIKDGHTLFFPANEWIEYHNTHSSFFPFKVFCKEQRLFIEANYSRTENLEKGAEILSINGIATDEIISHCLSGLMRDGNNLNYPIWILNNYFFEYYSYFYDHPDKFLLEMLTAEGIRRPVEIEALPKPEIRANRAKRYGNRAKARGVNQTEKDGITLHINSPEKTAVLTIRDFENGILKTVYKQDFKSTIKEDFEAIEHAGVENLILDLRGNQGGDLENGIFLLSHILLQPFQVVEAFYVVKNSETANDGERNKLKSGKGTEEFTPLPNAFKGRVYVLADGGSFSNSAIVSAAFRHYNRGKIIGEETGGNKTILCGYEEIITLPNTKLNIHIPTRQFVLRDKEKNDGHGVLPDVSVSPTIKGLVNGRDEIMEAALELIGK